MADMTSYNDVEFVFQAKKCNFFSGGGRMVGVDTLLVLEHNKGAFTNYVGKILTIIDHPTYHF